MDRLLRRIKSLAKKNERLLTYKRENGTVAYTETKYKLDKNARMALKSLARSLDKLEYEVCDEVQTIGGEEYARMQKANGFEFDHIDLDANYDIPVITKVTVSHGRSVGSDLKVDKEKGFEPLLFAAFENSGYDGVRYWLQEYKEKLNNCKTDYPHYYHLRDRENVDNIESMIKAMSSHIEFCVLRTA